MPRPTDYQREKMARDKLVAVELTDSPDDGGWYATVVDGHGAELHVTDIQPAEDGAWTAAREWVAEHRPDHRLIRI